MGAHTVRVTRVLDYRPDQGSGFADLSATLMINRADLPATQLVQPGSRVSRALLFAGEPGPIEDFRDWLKARKQRGERVQSVADASPQIRASADRAGRFLSLASLVSVLLSAIAVAMAAQRYARRHLDTVALMKCMGAPQRFVLLQTVLQLVTIALVTALAGTAIGYLAQSGIAWLLRDLLRGDLPPPSGDAFLLGVVTAVVVLVGFRAAAVAAPEARSAGPRAASRPRATAAALCGRVRAGDRRRARAAVLDRARPAARGLRGGWLGATFVVLAARGLGAGEGAGAAAQRRRRWRGATASPTSRAAAATASCRSWRSASASWCCCCSRWCATTCCATGSAACQPMRPTTS